jgi:hypothetical protein
MTAKERLHHLVDELPESKYKLAERILEDLRDVGLSDPLLRALLAAPYDDEPESEEERQAVKEAHRDIRAGGLSSDEEARRH